MLEKSIQISLKLIKKLKKNKNIAPTFMKYGLMRSGHAPNAAMTTLAKFGLVQGSVIFVIKLKIK